MGLEKRDVMHKREIAWLVVERRLRYDIVEREKTEALDEATSSKPSLNDEYCLSSVTKAH